MPLVLLSILTFSGCSCKSIVCDSSTCEKEIVYVDRNVTVNVPVKCEAELPSCNFQQETYTEQVSAMINCVGLLKIELRKCL